MKQQKQNFLSSNLLFCAFIYLFLKNLFVLSSYNITRNYTHFNLMKKKLLQLRAVAFGRVRLDCFNIKFCLIWTINNDYVACEDSISSGFNVLAVELYVCVILFFLLNCCMHFIIFVFLYYLKKIPSH